MKLLVLLGAVLVLLSTGETHLRKFDYKRIELPLNADVGEPLILTPYLEQNRTEEARNLSAVNYDGFLGVESYSGYFTVNKPFNSNLFFWFFPSESSYKDDPVVLWLQGGPGSPSMYGLFTENGPFIIDADGSVSLREYSWTKNHSVIYIDSPAGTGFSFTTNGYAANQTQVGDDLYSALEQFFTLFPELQKNEFFVTGESYAGKYIPAIGHAIQKYNPTGKVHINLKGLMIGNGLSDPVNQMDYGEYTYQLGLVDVHIKEQLNNLESSAKTAIAKEDYYSATTISNDLMINIILDASGISSIYNYLQTDDDDDDLDAYWQALVQSADIRKAIHVGDTIIGDYNVLEYLYADITKSVAPWVSELLNQYRMLLYNGQLDVILPYALTVNYLQNLNFSAAEVYKVASRHIWYVGDQVAGYYKTAGNLTECLVRNAGHMVPFNQPKWASDLLYKFTRNISL